MQTCILLVCGHGCQCMPNLRVVVFVPQSITYQRLAKLNIDKKFRKACEGYPRSLPIRCYPRDYRYIRVLAVTVTI